MSYIPKDFVKNVEKILNCFNQNAMLVTWNKKMGLDAATKYIPIKVESNYEKQSLFSLFMIFTAEIKWWISY